MLLLCGLLGPSSALAQRERQAANPAPTATPAPTAAQREAARRAFVEGTEHYEQGRYREAMAAFERAHAATGSPELLYNLYTAAQRAGELEQASEALAGYLASSAVPADERPALEARLVRLREEIRAAEAARVAQEEADREAEQEEARRLAEAEARAREAEARAARGAPPVSPAATVAFVVGGGGLVGFAVFAGLALREDRRVGQLCGVHVGSYCTDSDVLPLRALSFSADVALGIGLAGAATGMVIYFVQRARRRSLAEGTQARLRLSPVLGGPRGAWGVTAGGSF